MEQKQRFFIYDRKELGVLVLLGIAVAAFAFTLGIHLGKRLNPREQGTHAQEAAPVETVGDKVPTKQELTEQAKGETQAADESLGQALRDEVARTGAKLETPRQVELPEETKGETKTAEKPVPEHAAPAPEHEEHAEAPAPAKPAPHAATPPKHVAAATPPAVGHGKFTLQVGSFPSESDAQGRVSAIAGMGLKPFVREADIKGKGHWYRVFVGNFDSKTEAERAGKRFQSQKMIDSFIVAKLATE